jgi:tetratricopeptide (TPR) repeat protein
MGELSPAISRIWLCLRAAGGCERCRAENSFCVALHEALTGRHPFAADQPGTTHVALLARIHAGAREPGEHPLPGWLRKVLHRGLQRDPAARHPSMHALLRELAATPARRRRRALLATGLALGVAASALTFVGLGTLEQDTCAADLSNLWDEPTRHKAEATLHTSGLGNAAEVWQRLAPRIDDAVDAWRLASQQTCRARQQQGGPGDDALRLRELCLLRHRAELAGVTALLRAPDPDTLLAAIAALDQRTPLAACDDPERLRRELAPIAATAELVTRESLLHQILALKARAQASAPHALLPEIQRLTALSATRHDPGLHAHALHLQGLAEETLGQHDRAAASLRAGLHEALAARHDRLHAELAVRLVWLHGVLRRDSPRAASWAEHADAALRAIGGDPLLGPRLLDHRGAIASQDHDDPAAERLHRAAIALRGPTANSGVDQAMSLANLGLALLARGDLDAAKPPIAAALDRYRALFGPHHPTVAAVLSNLGQAHVAAGQRERGIELLRDALRLKEQSLGRDHLALLTTLNNLGNAHSELGHSAEARAHYLRALAIGERQLGPDSPQLEYIFHNLAFEAWQLGDHAELIRHAARALALQRRQYGEQNPILAPTLELLARGQLGAGRPAEALVTIELALTRARAGHLAPPVLGAVLLSVAWIRHHTGAAAPHQDPLLAEAERLLHLAPGPSPDQARELQALRAAP